MSMTVSELFPQLSKLSRVEKLKIIEFLASSLAQDEPINELTPNSTYQVWSPYDSHQASHQLASLFEKEENQDNV